MHLLTRYIFDIAYTHTDSHARTSMSAVHLETNTMTCTILFAFYIILYENERIIFESKNHIERAIKNSGK